MSRLFDADLGESGCSPYGLDIKNIAKQEKDKREYPKCNSNKVKTVLELAGKSCPKCKEGIIMEIRLGISYINYFLKTDTEIKQNMMR